MATTLKQKKRRRLRNKAKKAKENNVWYDYHYDKAQNEIFFTYPKKKAR